jgi:hypothetical protein
MSSSSADSSAHTPSSPPLLPSSDAEAVIVTTETSTVIKTENPTTGAQFLTASSENLHHVKTACKFFEDRLKGANNDIIDAYNKFRDFMVKELQDLHEEMDSEAITAATEIKSAMVPLYITFHKELNDIDEIELLLASINIDK